MEESTVGKKSVHRRKYFFFVIHIGNNQKNIFFNSLVNKKLPEEF